MYALLNGDWQLAWDPDDLGRREGWETSLSAQAQHAPVPGCIHHLSALPRRRLVLAGNGGA